MKSNIHQRIYNSNLMNPTIQDNYYMFYHFYNLIYLICLNRFSWDGLPNNIDSDFVEKTLIDEGQVAFVKTFNFGLIACHCIGDDYNIYGKPARYFCFTDSNKYPLNKYYDFDSSDIVVIDNNKLKESSHDFIRRYALNLSKIKQIKEMNLDTQKVPFIIKGSESEILSLRNKYEQMKNFEPLIVEYDKMNDTGLTVFQTGVKFLGEEFQKTFKDEFEECMNFLGIKVRSDKKERMITEEVQQGDNLVDLCLSIFLNSRLKGIEELNKKFGCNVTLKLSEYNRKEVEPKNDNNGIETKN